MNKVIIYCKLEKSMMTDSGEGAIIYSKQNKNSLEIAMKLLKVWEGEQVILTISPLEKPNRARILVKEDGTI
ncbi:MAG: hypothetical protein QXK24_00010 [Ignisphaera sp.]